MATRTTPDQVKQIIEVDSTIVLTPFILTANALVNWLSSKDTDGLLDSTMLELIERWLAAHFYSQRDQQYQAKTTGGASGTFQGATSMVLTSTLYGQTALLLDVTGYLAERSKDAEQGNRRKAGISWLGKGKTEYGS